MVPQEWGQLKYEFTANSVVVVAAVAQDGFLVDQHQQGRCPVAECTIGHERFESVTGDFLEEQLSEDWSRTLSCFVEL